MDASLTTALTTLLNNGTLGAGLVLSLWVNWKLWTKVNELSEKRIADLKETNSVVIGPLSEVKDMAAKMLIILQTRS